MQKRALPILVCCMAVAWFIRRLDAQEPVVPAVPVVPAEASAARQLAADKAKIESTVPQAQLVFVATISKVTQLGETQGIPPNILMEVTVKDTAMLKGPGPETLSLPPSFRYAAAKGQAFTPVADQKILVMGNAGLAGPVIGGPPTPLGQERKVGTKLNVLLMLPATEEHVAMAKKALGLATSPLDDGKAKEKAEKKEPAPLKDPSR